MGSDLGDYADITADIDGETNGDNPPKYSSHRENDEPSPESGMAGRGPQG